MTSRRGFHFASSIASSRAVRGRRVGLGERADRGPIDHRAVGQELRSVAGAVPAFFKAVPMDDASNMSANRAPLDKHAIFPVIDGMLGKPAADDCSLARRDLVYVSDFAGTQIFAEIGDDGSLASDIFAKRQSCFRLSCRVEQPCKVGLVVAIEGDEIERAGNAIGDALAAVAAVDVDFGRIRRGRNRA